MTKSRPAPRPFELDPAGGPTVVEEVSPEEALIEAEAALEGEVAAPAAQARWGRPAAGPVHAGRRRRRRRSGDRTTSPACWRPTRCWGGRSRSSWAMALFALTAFATGEIADMRRLSRRAATRAGRRPHRRLRSCTARPNRSWPRWRRSSPSRPLLKANVEQFNAQRHDAMSDGELLRLFERQVLAPVDRQAYRLVLQSSRDIGLLTALSPLGLLDGVLVLWRTSILFRSVARLYGMAPGPDRDRLAAQGLDPQRGAGRARRRRHPRRGRECRRRPARHALRPRRPGCRQRPAPCPARHRGDPPVPAPALHGRGAAAARQHPQVAVRERSQAPA